MLRAVSSSKVKNPRDLPMRIGKFRHHHLKIVIYRFRNVWILLQALWTFIRLKLCSSVRSFFVATKQIIQNAWCRRRLLLIVMLRRRRNIAAEHTSE